MRLVRSGHAFQLATALLLVGGLVFPAIATCAPKPACPCCGSSNVPMKGCGGDPDCIQPTPSPDHPFLPSTAHLQGPVGGESSLADLVSQDWAQPGQPIGRNLPLFGPSPGDTPRYLTLSVLRI